MTYPKRLIEVDLPIRRISAHARREKSIRHGHISTLHIWWARRPLAACRAVICAALWPDPADPLCPQSFRDEAAGRINAFAAKASEDMKLLGTSSEESKARWLKLAKPGKAIDACDAGHLGELRGALLDFIADFSNWDNSTVHDYLDTSRELTQAAHEALGGAPGTRPLVVDPFAGGGSIPLEALRVGADAFASDLNPVPVLLNKVVLEYIPKYGQRLANEVRKWGAWIKQEAEKELAAFYPKDPDGATPIAYLWARTIQCEGPGCGAEVPLIRSLWLAKTPKQSIAVKLIPNVRERRVDFQVVRDINSSDLGNGTIARGSATCPCCGFTTPVKSVRAQLRKRKGGAADARLYAVVSIRVNEVGRFYRSATDCDIEIFKAASEELTRRVATHVGVLPLLPDELTPRGGGSGAGRAFSQRYYGMEEFSDLFTPRQLLALTTLARFIRQTEEKMLEASDVSGGLVEAVQTCLALALNKQADSNSSLCAWRSTSQDIGHTFGRQALPMVWDFVEANVFSGATRDWLNAVQGCLKTLECLDAALPAGHVERGSATEHPLPDESVMAFVTDPPYYDAVPYADLSDFFYVWLKRTLPTTLCESFADGLTPKEDECILDEIKGKDRLYFEHMMSRAMAEGRRIIQPSGVGVVVFAHKSTGGWEAQLQAMVDAGWTMSGSWPIDTEMGTRLRAKDSAALASSVHLVCRRREVSPDCGSTHSNIGDWREVLSRLPVRIHEWMPRLASEGIVGADAIFACLGPALEIFSRYSRVEKASGEVVTLREYLEQVWAAVSTEALSMIFKDADAAGLEPDARLTAMWLWTLGGGANGNGVGKAAEQENEDLEATAAAGKAAAAGFTLEYDAARKIAQGLGVHLEKIPSVVEVKGDKARLRGVAERTKHLFGKDETAPAGKRRKKKSPQKTLFEDLEEVEGTEGGGWSEMQGPPLGATVLDRVHQAMILFAAGRSEAIKRFLIEDGAGADARFWKLAQSLSALYPQGSDEKRWVDGVLARKKGWGM